MFQIFSGTFMVSLYLTTTIDMLKKLTSCVLLFFLGKIKTYD